MRKNNPMPVERICMASQTKKLTPSNAHKRGSQTVGRIRESKNTGNANMTKPNAVFTFSIQAPDFGRILLPNTVIRMSGKPMPRANKYKVNAPITKSPDCATYSNAPDSGAEVQGEATKPAIAPMANTPKKAPLFCC